MTSIDKYNHQEIEAKWQKAWETDKLYEVDNNPSNSPKYYCLDMFPYPSGAGLHVGHVEGYTGSDVISRYMRMKGYEVLHPMGWDSFGLPAENYAIKTGIHPKITTSQSIDTFRSQIKNLGLSYDWNREIAAHSPEYYRWTQWLFSIFYKNDLAYKSLAKVNWCENCKTVLANEQVIDGRCERCENPVVFKELEQWFFRMTKYADELVDMLDELDWPESTKNSQRNWIGRKEGLNIEYRVEGTDFTIVCFTTRPETNYGATFIVVNPEHPLVETLFLTQTTEDDKTYQTITKYIDNYKSRLMKGEKHEDKEKTGVFTGYYAINPLNNNHMPIYISDYVVSDVGTGAVVGVPGHDFRDFEFAIKFNLPIKRVVKPNGIMKLRSIIKGFNKEEIQKLKEIVTNIRIDDAHNICYAEIVIENKSKYLDIIAEILANGAYCELVGEDFEFVFKDISGNVSHYMYTLEDEGKIVDKYNNIMGEKVVSENMLIGYLGKFDWYKDLIIWENDGLLVSSGIYNGMQTRIACREISDYACEKGFGQRKVVYKLRDWLVSRQRYWGSPIPIVYDPNGNSHLVEDTQLPWILPEDVEFKPMGMSPLGQSKELQKRVESIYGTGWRAEIDTMDTFVCSSWYYFRFADPNNIHEFSSKEAIEKWLPVDAYIGGAEHTVLHLLYSRFVTKALCDLGYINFREPFMKLRHPGIVLAEDKRKMSKRWGNVINPNDVVTEFGADAVRLYELFMGPFSDVKPWSTKGLVGCKRFLDKVYRNFQSMHHSNSDEYLSSQTVTMLSKVNNDLNVYKFNTAIAAFMIWINEVTAQTFIPSRKDWMVFLKAFAPFAPHLTEELWHIYYPDSIHKQDWPNIENFIKSVDENSFKKNIPVQINGKVRGSIGEDLLKSVSENDRIRLPDLVAIAGDRDIKKVIYVPNRIVNIVV